VPVEPAEPLVRVRTGAEPDDDGAELVAGALAWEPLERVVTAPDAAT
jgi:hypothetical protein